MKPVGIDLGTTNSAIAIINEFGKPEIIPNAEGERVTPSVVLFEKDQIIVGSVAKQSMVSDPDNTVAFIKPQMGSSDFTFFHEDKEFQPEDISAIILKKIVKDAENALGDTIKDVVITVPAYFNDRQRKATIDAGKIAGLNVLQIINEPTAAALTYGLNRDKEQNIMVYDLGGGTFDVTIMKISSNKFDVIASDGDKHLGGKDFDEKIMLYCNELFKEEHGIDLFDDPISQQDLRLKAENAKIILSSKESANLYISAQGKSKRISINRDKFSELVADYVTRTELLLDSVLADSNLSWDDIDEILMVGGSTRMKVIHDIIRRVSGKEPNIQINPDESVALGASIQAGIISAKDTKSELGEMVRMKYAKINVGDVTSHSFGAVTLDEFNNKRNAVIIPKNSKIPVRKSQIFYTSIKDQTSVKLTVLQGEDPDPEFCTTIGTTKLEFSAKKINSPIIFNYEYDINGIIHATAKDPETGKQSIIQIKREGSLSGSEVKIKAVQLNDALNIDNTRKDFSNDNEEPQLVSDSSDKPLHMLSDVFTSDVLDSENIENTPILENKEPENIISKNKSVDIDSGEFLVSSSDDIDARLSDNGDFNSSNLDITVNSLESEDDNDWDRVLKVMEIEDEESKDKKADSTKREFSTNNDTILDWIEEDED